jgi:hypothetical protein
MEIKRAYLKVGKIPHKQPFALTNLPAIINSFPLRNIIISLIIIISFPVFLKAQNIQIIAGVGKNDISKNAQGSFSWGNKFKSSIYQYYGLNFQIETFKRLYLQVGGGVSFYKFPVYQGSTIVIHDTLILPDREVDRIHLRCVSVPIGIQYEVFRNFKIHVGYQINFSQSLKSNMSFIDKLSKTCPAYYYGLNYTLFDRIEIGYIQHKFLKYFGIADKINYQEDYFKYQSWYFYVSYVFRFKSRDKAQDMKVQQSQSLKE